LPYETRQPVTEATSEPYVATITQEDNPICHEMTQPDMEQPDNYVTTLQYIQ
jgi:hypothetical protein